jgi:pimeloyl-ACP methyl ester carboxylesterase
VETCNGTVRIAYEDLGGAGGDPLLLVMGLGVSRHWWPAGFVSALVEQGFHVVAYDQRDSGESTRFADQQHVHPFAALFRARSPYTAEDMTDDAVAVLDAVGWDSAHVFGHSMGGLLAQRIALRHPGRVRSITVSGAMPSDVRGLGQLRHVGLGFVLRMSRVRFPEGPEGDVAAGLALARAIASPAYPFDEAAVRAMVEREAISGVRDARAQSRQIGATWHGGRLAEVTVPALVLHGEQDPVVRPSAARATAAAIPDARLVLLPGVGHDLPRALWPHIAGEVRALADRAR